jgi:hypothetical protein
MDIYDGEWTEMVPAESERKIPDCVPSRPEIGPKLSAEVTIQSLN